MRATLMLSRRLVATVTLLHLALQLGGCAAAKPREPAPSPAPAPSAASSEDVALPPLPAGRGADVIFWPTPPPVVDKMLEVAGVTSSDVVYDLGSGDGRILIAAAKKYGARGIGYEIDEKLVEESRRIAKEQGVDHLVTFEAKDIFTVDLTPATVVALYLLPGMIQRLIPQLKKLKPGSRIVSHNFPMPNVEPEKVFNADQPGSAHTVMLWHAPIKVSRPPPAAAGQLQVFGPNDPLYRSHTPDPPLCEPTSLHSCFGASVEALHCD